jgi:photosystem II stability/assembly factor-like uncharacterized protein
MLRPLSIAATGTGVAVLLAIACSGSFEPTTAFFQTPEPAPPSDGPTVTPQVSGTANRLQAVSPVNASVVWASGVGGTFVMTVNGGKTWKVGVVPGAEELQFRDVQGVNDKVAYLLSADTGTSARIYKTKDGGATWTLQFQNHISAAFYDCFAFWTPDRGITFSDAVDGRFPVIKTSDGRTWRDIGDQMPVAQPGEAAFAASGTCVATQGGKRAWIATGGAAKARILATTDGGASWNAYDTPIAQGTPTSGGVSVAFRDPFHGILGGGELDPSLPQEGDNVAVSSDGGKSWTTEGISQRPFGGAIYGLAYVPGFGQRTVVATGPGGAAWSRDEGHSWTNLPADVTGFWAVAFAGRKAGWLVGTDGRIMKLSF